MNRLNSNYRWLPGLVLCLPFIVGPLSAQQGQELAEQDAEYTESSSWQVKQGVTEQKVAGDASLLQEGDVSLLQEGDVSLLQEGDVSQLEESDASQAEELLVEPERTARPNVISDTQLRNDVDEAYAALTKALEEEDSFSPILGEHYLGYGNILLRAGQPVDARKALVSALHIQKVNNGIYDLQQRHILKSIFDTHYALDEPEKYEDILRRIIWLEDKNDGYVDDLTYDMILKVGNANIDLFLRKPSSSELALSYLSKAKRYLQYAVRRFGGVPLSEKKMPFGELALVSLLQGVTIPTVERRANDRFSGFDGARQRNRRLGADDYIQSAKLQTLEAQVGSDQELRQYFLKAKAEGNKQEMVHALLNLGDMAQLFQRSALAHRYYESAWRGAQDLAVDDPLRTQMDEPVELPAFNYAMTREHVERRQPSKLIPMSFDVMPSGKSSTVLPMAETSEYIQYYKSARRALRKLTFRPAIVDGQVLRTSMTEYGVRVTYVVPADKAKLDAKKKARRREIK